MTSLKLTTTMSTSISSPRSLWMYRSFVSSTRPLTENAKIDKETCEKIKQAAEAVTQGAKKVVKVGNVVEDKVADGAKNVITDVAKKAADKATEDDNKNKGVWERTKNATINIKEKIVGK